MKAAIFIVLCTFAGAAHCLLSYSAPGEEADNVGSRLRWREVPLEYMRKLYNAKHSPSNDETTDKLESSTPTDIWCYSDKDVIKQTFRENIPQSGTCASLTRYVFQWYSLAETLSQTDLNLERAFLRSYIKFNQQYLNDRDGVKIGLTTTTIVYNGSSAESGADSSYQGLIYTGQQDLVLAQASDQWVEITLTDGVRHLWPQIQQSTEIQVTIEATVDCVDQANIPFSFVNPATIPLGHSDRESSFTFQPLLLIFANDAAAQSTKLYEDNSNTIEPPAAVRDRRSTGDHCQRYNLTVVFSDIGLQNIILPYSLNIGICSGSCLHSILRQYSSLGTNHAKLMASIHEQQALVPNSLITSDGPAINPCCSPASYKPPTELLLQEDDEGFSITQQFKDLEVATCGCH